MTTASVKDAWCEVGDELEALGLKLKLHLEQERSAQDDDEDELLERLGQRLDAAIDAVENAAEDEAVRQDLRATRELLVAAVGTTFRTARDEVRRAASR